MLRAAENGHVQTARWLYETKGFEIDEEQRPTFIQHALRVGDLEFADLFLPTDGTKWVLLEYDNMRPSPALIEWMLDLGYLTWDLHLAGSAIRDLADYGSLSLMQQIFTLHSPLQKDDDRLPEYWMEASLEGDISTLTLTFVTKEQ
ncbi:hypothetical protein V7S43_017447 [Phytophthora oleae]|uniref:Uncharacterized protein n=1 Tax=Phytophthora oleae TaxID=2107226 RepID=A0ABD3ETZ6_9STRA